MKDDDSAVPVLAETAFETLYLTRLRFGRVEYETRRRVFHTSPKPKRVDLGNHGSTVGKCVGSGCSNG